VPVLADVEWRERTGLEDALRKGLLALQKKKLGDFRPKIFARETKLRAYRKCSFDKPVWLHTHIVFSRRWWISWWNATKSVGSRTAVLCSQNIPVCCGCLCTGLWEYCWRWYSSAFSPRYILCPHQVNKQACISQQ